MSYVIQNAQSEAFDALAGLKLADEHLERVLRGQAFLVEDGAMGTALQRRNLLVPGVVPELLSFTNPADITEIHAEYVAAGADIATTNTFGANRLKLPAGYSVASVYAAAVACARAANPRYVAADVGPLGALLAPMGELSFEEAYDLFAEQMDAIAATDADLIIIETLSDLREAKAALLAARERTNLPVFVTMTFEEDGRTFLGTPPAVAASTLSALGAHAIGTNCSLGPAEMVGTVAELVAHSRVPVAVQPNAGLPVVENGETVYRVSAQEFGQAMEGIAAAGATIMGGCCGTDPSFIAQVRALVDRLGEPQELQVPNELVLTSAQQAVVLPAGNPGIVVIGERINPTGKPKLKAALREADYDYVLGEAKGQQKLGADVLDVNVGLPELDEPAVLRAVVERVQSACTLPLVIDSSNPEAVENAVRSYAGRPLINSVNGKRESLDAVLPLVKRYGACVIGLTLDEAGIPSTAEGRFAIAQRIVEEAAKLGIPACDIVIDCLTMAVATNQPEAVETLRAIKMVKERLGVRTALGVSNISFGLPERSVVNSTFLAAAFGAGLDMPILNPNDARYRHTVASYRVLNAQDVSAVSYIGYIAENPDPYAQAKAGSASAVPATSAKAAASAPASADASASAHDASDLPVAVGESFVGSYDLVKRVQECVLDGQADSLPDLTSQLLEKHEALEIINGLFIPVLDEVGRLFDEGEFFLPQLMSSANAVKAGFDTVKAAFADAGIEQGERIILATVEGDIHDIGKNIVKMLLENYGYQIIDLGRDVAAQAVVDAAREHDVKLVGLSALMTTTVRSMEETIQLLREQLPEVKVIVGGAVLTPDYAERIGADFYAKDASETARIAAEFFGR